MKHYVIYILLITGIILIGIPSSANNVRSPRSLTATVSSSGVVSVNFSVSWDNAWCDGFNWDAVWAFVKYRKKGSADAWEHGYLTAEGHSTNGLNLSLGKTGDLGMGVFLSPQFIGAGNVADKGVTLVLDNSRLKITPAEIKANQVDFTVMLVEMVLVPGGSYYLGDGGSTKALSSDAGTPLLIEGERTEYRVKSGGDIQTVDARYPKGYLPFYVMKYELSQAQYVAFLNMLNREQQKYRFPDLDKMAAGTYAFGGKSVPSDRNGIVVWINESDRPVIFANNLTKDDLYNNTDDGQTMACNYLSPGELLSYADWAGLRPMSELEFEKACRKPYPAAPQNGEYAWGTTVLNTVTSLAEITDPGTAGEASGTAGRNTNGVNGVGPLRCGIFASGTGVTQEEAGATSTGIMDMSGNLREICYNINGGFGYVGLTNEIQHGKGILTPTGGGTTIADNYWPQDKAYFMVKGGGFSSQVGELRTSDRSLLQFFPSYENRDKTVGVRAVRSASAPENYVNPGVVVGMNGYEQDTVCQSPDVQVYAISSKQLPSFMVPSQGIDWTYNWYLKKGDAAWELIPGENQPELTWQGVFTNTTDALLAYRFKREAIFPAGSISSPEFIVWVFNSGIRNMTNPAVAMLDKCDKGSELFIQLNAPALFTWKCNGRTVSLQSGSSSKYTIRRDDVTGLTAPYKITCDVNYGYCVISEEFALTVEERAADMKDCPCGSVVVYEGTDYHTVEIGTDGADGNGGKQCWMVENLNVGEIRKSTDQTMKAGAHRVAGIQKWCINDNNQNCSIYGGMYDWWEAICGGKCSDALTSDFINFKGATLATMKSYGAKLSPDGMFIKGICPEGWHMPDDLEWQALEAFIGVCSSDLGANGTWDIAGEEGSTSYSVAGKLMKEAGGWCTTNCNSTGFSALYGGYYEYSGSAYKMSPMEKYVLWWTAKGSTTSSSSLARGISSDPTLLGDGYARVLPTLGAQSLQRYSRLYIRCIKDYSK